MNRQKLPWIEKYRPTEIENIMTDKYSRNKIINIIKEKNMPNIIIAGVPGIGKTTTLLCIVNKLLGKHAKDGALELNASDDRGIKSVQELTNFCKKKLNIKEEDEDKYSKHKMILFDEADNMTRKAQQLVNNLMEKYRDTTKFAFTCNNSSKIIEAIQSRCIIFRYRRLSRAQVEKRILEIAKLENLEYDDDGIDAIVISAQGDMRQALNNLQLTSNGYGKITQNNVFKICARPHPEIIKGILYACCKKKLKKAIQGILELKEMGFSCYDITYSILNILKTSSLIKMDEITKIKFMTEISKSHLNTSQGLVSLLQVTGCIAKLCE